jgi:hypothetical protein
MIQDRGVPCLFRGEDNVGVLLKLVICIRTKLETSKAIPDDERDKVAFEGADTLLTSDDIRLVINRKTIMIECAG